jgi:hypothetical protein
VRAVFEFDSSKLAVGTSHSGVFLLLVLLFVCLGNALAALSALVVLARTPHVVESELGERNELAADGALLGFLLSFHYY